MRETEADLARLPTEFLDSGPVYWRIEPERMFTFQMPG
jgi:hypothetical protein